MRGKSPHDAHGSDNEEEEEELVEVVVADTHHWSISDTHKEEEVVGTPLEAEAAHTLAEVVVVDKGENNLQKSPKKEKKKKKSHQLKDARYKSRENKEYPWGREHNGVKNWSNPWDGYLPGGGG